MVEEIVAREYEEFAKTQADFCGCPMCRDDVMVYALNRLPPRYVAQRTGQVLTHISMETGQPRTDVSVVLLEAFRRVHAEPRPGHPPRERA